MNEKDMRHQRQREEDAVFNRMLLCLVGVVVAEAIILLVKRFYINFTISDFGLGFANVLSKFFLVFSFAGLVLLALGIVWCILRKKKNLSIRLSATCTVIVTFFWIVSLFAYYLNSVGVEILIMLPIAAAVLILIYFLYPRAFFFNAVVTGFGMAGLWWFRQYQGELTIVLFVIGWLILVAIAILAYVAKKNNGKIGKLRVVNDQSCYPACWITSAVVLLATLLGVFLGVGIAYYLIYVLIGWIFCLAVFYTVKLM